MCLKFINAENVGLAQYKLIHQYKEGSFPDVTFASGTTRALFLRKFLYADSSKRSNFTVFAFHKQEPNSANQQTNFLICHLIQEQGQKKSLNEIKASLKQAVHIPSNFVCLGTQPQLFAVASSIFFGNESVWSNRLKHLLHLVGQNKKSFCDQIQQILCCKIPFAIDRKVQRWL